MQKRIISLIIYVVLLITVACSTQQPSPISTPTAISSTPTRLPPTAALSVFKQDSIPEIDAMFTRLADDGLYNGAVLVAHQGEVVLSQGYGLADRKMKIPNTPQTQFRIGSITKQFTAMAILILQNQGKLNVTDHVCNYFADCPPAWQRITIHHLLTHTSGIPNYTELGLDSSLSKIHHSPEEIMAFFEELPLDFQPGEDWYYSNSGYIILGYIIENASDMPYEKFLQQSIFNPLNMEATGYIENTDGVVSGYLDRYTTEPVPIIDVSNLFASGGLYSTVEDLYRWDQSLYTEQLLPQALIDQMFAPHATTRDSDEVKYGYAWLLLEDNGHAVKMHMGSIEGFTSLIARYPEMETTIILLSNQHNKDVGYLGSTIARKVFGEG